MDETTWLHSVPSLIGYSGASIVALSYFANQKGLLHSEDWRFPGLNLAGSLMVMLSLYYQPNPPSVVIEIFWSAISLYGIQKNVRAARSVHSGRADPRLSADLPAGGRNRRSISGNRICSAGRWHQPAANLRPRRRR